ncbi:serine carboxypeptidase-like 7 [Silene latifolia]|uniref:serine carboxypeptidase-like 7 n=1 Tax=Silene latifolia TaxID=37657 RepID=UPI003D781D00
MSIHFVQLLSLLLLVVLIWPISDAAKHNTIKSLPGFPGNLPFHLHTGYVGVGEMEQVQLFYYFVESESDPVKDPLLLWLTGGPGCSAFSGLVIEIGPLNINDSASSWDSKIPIFQLNPFSWTKAASIVFLDSPVGTGFSYATTHAAYYSNDTLQSWHIYEFLSKWLVDHIEFRDNPLYISGDSYCGKIVPIVVQHIVNGNKADMAVTMNLKGYILGNPYTSKEDNTVAKFKYAERVSLLSRELFETTKKSCNGTYTNANVDCRRHLQAISDNLDPLFDAHVLKPKCLTPQTLCQETSYELLLSWANNANVQEALQIREGTKSQWIRCNKTLAYAYNVESTFGYHQNLTKEVIRALVYSGDQDLKVSYVGTLQWIKNLFIKILDDWRPWFVKGQVAGYTMKFSNGHYDLTFATVKGGGHTAPEYKRQECLAMVSKWLVMDPF